ncbi:hypothetical protein [Lacticaseibacillus pantheris]|uniref:hypothetical protein n=1 Tax=Lacticaseibacillus pantheris TaxID=171523 RepID=UPI0021E96559|nr:hypothetical protein [Lacticaseibacillus pantheris]
MAAGLSLPVDQVAALQEALAKDAAGANIGTPKLAIAAQVDVQDLTMDAYRELRRLAPFGEGNLEPALHSIPARWTMWPRWGRTRATCASGWAAVFGR